MEIKNFNSIQFKVVRPGSPLNEEPRPTLLYILQVVSKLAQATEKSDKQDIDIGQLDQHNHQDGAGTSEGKVD